MLWMSLTKPHFQSKVIKLANDFMYSCDLKVLREKNQATNVPPNNKWKFCDSNPFCHILNMSSGENLWHIPRKKVKNFSKKKEYYQFQVGLISYSNLKKTKAFKEQVYKCLSSQFYSTKSIQLIKTLKHYNTRIIVLVIFYDNECWYRRKNLCQYRGTDIEVFRLY